MIMLTNVKLVNKQTNVNT